MRLIDAESSLLRDLREESDVIAEKTHAGVTVVIARHPTLGRLVLIKTHDGQGLVVEADE